MQSYVDLLPGRRIAVIGDVMLDCYIEGDVERISPEAPVPILHAKVERSVPGGAANVAANLASLDVAVQLIGLVGEDEAHEQLMRALMRCGAVDVSGFVSQHDRPTIRKLRVMAGRQQVVRVDQEDLRPIDPAVENRLIAAAIRAIDATDVVAISDYGKGACSERLLRVVIDHARQRSVPVLVDPKRLDLSVYHGATILTPNRKELSAATGIPCDSDEQATAAAERAQKACAASILLTRSEKGMSFFPIGGSPLHMATVAQDVFDVSGAGDTVVAVLAAAMAAAVPIADAIRMANHAAGIVVSKLGTARVNRAELAAALTTDTTVSISDGRLLDRDSAVVQRWTWARERLTVGFANGCFDLLHPGHVSLIRQAAEHCDRLIVALNTDASVKRLKGETRPVQDERARAAVMGAIKGVAAVTLFNEDTPLELLEALQPDVLVKGADYAGKEVVGADIVGSRGGRVILAELTPGRSTSRLVEAMRVKG